jgi:hypothetical protein
LERLSGRKPKLFGIALLAGQHERGGGYAWQTMERI